MFFTRLAHASLDAEGVGKAQSWKLKQNHLIALALFAVWPSQGSEKNKKQTSKVEEDGQAEKWTKTNPQNVRIILESSNHHAIMRFKWRAVTWSMIQFDAVRL